MTTASQSLSYTAAGGMASSSSSNDSNTVSSSVIDGMTAYSGMSATTIGRNLRLDPDSYKSKQKYLEDQLPKIFGVKQDKNHINMSAGRHPRSLANNSEMGHYLDLSNKRQSRLQKGHTFWKVLEEESLISKYPTDRTHDRIVAAKEDMENTYMFEVPAPVTAKKSNGPAQVPKFNSMDDLEMRIDFKNKNQVNYNNTFCITNYMDEILYVNTEGELRCKPVRALLPTDRIKFRVLDLLNPSNPSSLKFDDPLWLQICENNDNGEVCA